MRFSRLKSLPLRDLLAFGIPFLGALSVYVFSLPPSVTLEDAGELVVAADYLGVPHPPGYPLWTLLAWGFQWIFHAVEFRGYPNPAWPVALMSAGFGAGACGLVGLTVASLVRGFWRSETPPASARPPFAGTGQRVTGAGVALALASLLQRWPRWGGWLFLVSGTLFLLTLALRGLTPAALRPRWHHRLPGVSVLGDGGFGFLVGAVCYLGVWARLPIPRPPLILPLAAAAALALLLLSLALRAGLDRAFTRPGFAAAMQTGGLEVWMGVAGGLLLGFSPLMYSQSVIVEVYSLNAFFLALLLFLMLKFIQRPTPRLLMGIGFLFALGLSNHQSLLFLVFFLVAGVAAAGQPRVLKGKTLPGLLLAGILGLGLHLYMPVASEQNPPMNWGNARTMEGFRHMLTRGQYAGFDVADNLRIIVDTLATPVDPDWTVEAHAAELARSHARRTLFLDMLGAFLHHPEWKTSIASQFSLQIPDGPDDPTGAAPPPPERRIPLALFGLVPLLVFSAFPRPLRGWFLSSLIAMFFLTVVFLIIQWPELNQNDLWVKRVQYIQAHVLFAVWMALGAALAVFLLYALLPARRLPLLTGIPLCALFIAFPLWKEFNDPRHLEQLGASRQRGHDFGWRFGTYQLKGANGILLDELAHHDDPDILLDEWAASYLERHVGPSEAVARVLRAADKTPIPRSEFRNTLLADFRGSEAERRWLEQAGMLAAFRALDPEAQAASLVHLHRPLPNWDYPAEMEPDAILFGGTDPGRFVPTYLIFSAGMRPDVYLITQTALADGTYQQTLRDLYGDEIFLPDLLDGNRAFLEYANELRLFAPEMYAAAMGAGDLISVSGVSEVNRINAILTRRIVEANRREHAFYFEQAVRMPWMTEHLRPHGLMFKLEPDPVSLSAEELRNNREFWAWWEEALLAPDPNGKRNRYQRDLPVRKSVSKLRMAQAWNFFERGRYREAERAMEQALRLYPANPEAAMRAADMWMRMGKFDRAERTLTDFAPHDPANPRLAAFAKSLRTLRTLDTQRVQLEKDLRLRPTGNTTLQLLQIYGHLEREDQVDAMADLLLKMENLQPDFYIHLAAVMQRREHAEGYKRAIVRWTEVDPNDARAWIDRAVIALSEERYTDMFRFMVRAVQLAPTRARQQLAQDPRFLDIRHWTQFQRLVQPAEKDEP